MPRSFLVKKYLKQKYDADLQQSLGLTPDSQDTAVTVPERMDTSDPESSKTVRSSETNVVCYRPTNGDSGKAVTPFTPSTLKPVAVRVSNGYILDVTSSSSTRNVGDAETSSVVARTPKFQGESAAWENPMPRRSVIVTNSNHPANRHAQGSNGSYRNESSLADNVGTHSSSRTMVSSAAYYRGNDPYEEEQPLALDMPKVAHMPSPPPAHAPLPSPQPAHTSSQSHSYIPSALPSPAHAPVPAHIPSPAFAPSPAHIPRSANSPTAAHLNLSRRSPCPDVLPADHPIHHPLIQHLINQKLHVPEEQRHYRGVYDDERSHSPRSNSPRSPPRIHENYYFIQAEEYHQPYSYVVAGERDVDEDRPVRDDEAQTRLDSTLIHPGINPNYLPPSPSPSIPSSSPTLPVVAISHLLPLVQPSISGAISSLQLPTPFRGSQRLHI